MPDRVTILPGQTIWDLSVQEFGTVDRAADILALNGLRVGDSLPAGGTLVLPPVTGSAELRTVVKALGVVPATGDLNPEPEPDGAFSSAYSSAFA